MVREKPFCLRLFSLTTLSFLFVSSPWLDFLASPFSDPHYHQLCSVARESKFGGFWHHWEVCLVNWALESSCSFAK